MKQWENGRYTLVDELFDCQSKRESSLSLAAAAAAVVHEKEKLRGHDSLRDDDDAGFGEYTRT